MNDFAGEKLNSNLDAFLRHIDAIKETLPMTILLIQPYNKKTQDKFSDYLKTNAQEIEGDNGEKKIRIKPSEYKLFETIERNASVSSLALKIIPDSLFVSLISQYDAFLTRLLRAIFKIKPVVLNSSERNLTFSQLVEMNSIENARELIIDKEIDSVLRKSHSEQFEYLEKMLNVKLRENLPIWKTFIEVTERRNLLVHCDGIVSNQYIKNCKENEYQVENIKIGERLGVTIDYFLIAYNCLFEITVKLTHTLWRKLLNADLKNADEYLNNICYDLINAKSFTLADILLEFACNQKKHYNDASKNIFIINGSLSKYLQKDKVKAKEILETNDWSASSDDFKLAHAVLTDDYDKSYETMKKIGANGDVKESNYKQWPLFMKIRNEDKFKETFREIFKEEYSILETPKGPLQDLISEEIKRIKKLKKKTIKKPDTSKKEAIEKSQPIKTRKTKKADHPN